VGRSFFLNSGKKSLTITCVMRIPMPHATSVVNNAKAAVLKRFSEEIAVLFEN
jgi:hypothetical protein